MRSFLRDETGQDLIEYSLVMVFIAIACVALFGNGNSAVQGIWSSNTNHLSSAATVAAGG